jgi:hypothetical protein
MSDHTELLAAIDQATWDEICFDTRDQMVNHVRPYVTPISRTDDPSYGWAWGTGNYVQLSGSEAYLLTNEHVAVKTHSEILSHLPTPGEYYERLSTFDVWPWPYDLARSPIDATRLAEFRRLIKHGQFDRVYQPVKGELLFWLGYPGTTGARFDEPTEQRTRYSWGGELETSGVPMLTQEYIGTLEANPDGYRADLHTLVQYPELARKTPEGPETDVPNPHGMSGSLLWDTKRVACGQLGKPWTPAESRVCGLIFATWDRPAVVIATRVEHILACLEGSERGAQP